MKEKAQDDGHEHETFYVSIASADEMEDDVAMESIHLNVTDMAHAGDLDAGCLVQEEKCRQDVDETDELAHTPRRRRTRKRRSETRGVRDPSNGREARREDRRGGQTAGTAGERER